MSDAKTHWNNIYSTKTSNQVSWTQAIPATSLDLVHTFSVRKDAPIIDVGGGESRFVDFLLDQGYSDITVLDISEQALENTRKRLGAKATNVRWIVSDVTAFEPSRRFTVWHDRATFHFLTTEIQIARYVQIASQAISYDGYMAIGTFSDNGPAKCSGLAIKQYSEDTLSQTLAGSFNKIRCVTEDHITPFQTVQNFLFCSFKRKE
ncbi:class I SAM-dependent methyltransferase [Dawidia soli]|uniref:Class I SAM-dependent methyltransferase n=1 Tax=Dawidia soli TaxID=2782352 RepID=A0AAP2GKN2_9BACT|nr:class I SAM-dependent methyltransferase [Dawidia soli]MBT1689795.1 class I SAM-dependent methyltransferase [Dawidia soli]